MFSKKRNKAIGLTACFLLFWSIVFAQKVRFTVNVSPSASVLMGNTVEVQFTLENAGGLNFQPPSFEGFEIVSGPNQSSSFSMINGTTTQSMSYSYYLEPKDIGNYYIEPASIEADGEILTTSPVEVIVELNPDGIIQQPERQQRSNTFDFFNMPELKEFRDRVPQEKQPKKKRKIYRI